MSQSEREIGTLIVVILKARHLPNKRHIGKQTPYCAVGFNGERRRTKAIHRGGQHPEWDEEVRFTLYEDNDDNVPKMTDLETPPALPPKKTDMSKRKIKGGHFLALSCYADDPREPDLIGETKVDLTEVLTKGETDEWFTIMNKERYCGDVYLEMTFWSNEPVPQKKAKAKPNMGNKQYGGAGSFVPAGSPAPDGRPEGYTPSRVPSSSGASLIPPSLRSHITGSVDLYVAPYESAGHHNASSVDQITSEFAELGVHHPRQRRESYTGPYSTQTVWPAQPSPGHSYPESVYAESAYPDATSSYEHTPAPSGYQTWEPSQAYPGYEQAHQASSFSHRSRPRYSLPTTSSGFAPLGGPPASSGFMPIPQYMPEEQVYAPGPGYEHGYDMHSAPPAGDYAADYHADYPYQPAPPGSQMSMAHPPQSSFQYSPYPPPAPPASAPPQSYMQHHAPMSVPGPSHSAPPQAFPAYDQPGSLPPPPHLPQPATSPTTPVSSRPLPQPGPHRQASLPLSSAGPGGFSQPSVMNVPPPPPLPHSFSVGSIPPPPPPPLSYSTSGSHYAPAGNGQGIPPPPPLSSMPTGRPALPQPPAGYPPQSSAFSAVPPPPPLQHLPTPPNAQPSYPGPPPRPPSSVAQWQPPPALHAGHSY